RPAKNFGNDCNDTCLWGASGGRRQDDPRYIQTGGPMCFFRPSRRGYIRDWRAPPWREPTLKELLSEPIITALMDADSIDPAELKAILGEASAQLRSRANGSHTQRSKGSVFCADRVKQESLIYWTASSHSRRRGKVDRHDRNCIHADNFRTSPAAGTQPQ